MALVSLVIASVLSFQDADRGHIDELVKDLSSASLGTRLSAENELRGIGKGALPALEKAAADADPERARRAKALIQELGGPEKDEKEARTDSRLRVLYKDVARGVHFELRPDGSVMLKAPADGVKKGDLKTWTAKSPDEFREKYPELVGKYGLDGVLASGDPDAEFERMMANLERLMEARAKRWREQEQAPANGRPSFGVRASEVPEALRSHLNLDAGRGALVLDVAQDSLAARAGLERHDIVTEIDGKAVQGVDAFAKEIGEALGRDGFVLKTLRRGEPRELTVTPAPAK